MAGLFKPKSKILGADIAGIVEAVGKNVCQFSIGDAVFGGRGAGGFAEYICLTENNIELKPDNCTFAEAAGVFVAAVTALQALRDKGEIRTGQKVAINGASGGVGTFAIQVAKAYGADVTAICSAEKSELARELGADRVIDYKREDFTVAEQRYDLILAANGDHSLSDYRRVLTPTGKFVACGGGSRQTFQPMLFGRWLSKKDGQQLRFLMANQNKKDLATLKELLETGKIKTVLDSSYSLKDTAEAVRYLELGRAKGKIIIEMD